VVSRKTRGPSGVCSAGGGAAGADAGAEGAFLDAGRNAPEEAFEVRSFGRPRGRKAGFTNARCSGSGGGARRGRRRFRRRGFLRIGFAQGDLRGQIERRDLIDGRHGGALLARAGQALQFDSARLDGVIGCIGFLEALEQNGHRDHRRQGE